MHIVAWCGDVYMQLFHARKLLHSALTGYESGERDGAGREGVKDTSLKRNLIKISTGLDQHSAHKRIPLPSPSSARDFESLHNILSTALTDRRKTGLDQHSAHKRIPLPSPSSIHRTAISPSYSQTRFLERSSNNWE